MTGSFPLQINNQEFSTASFSGKKYARAYPELLEAVVEHTKAANWYTATCVLSKPFYPRNGEFSFTLSTNKAIKAGMLFRAYDTVSGAFSGIVKSYDRDSGIAVLLVEGFSPVPLSGRITIEATAAYYVPNLTAPLAVAAGGTGSSTVLTAMEACGIPHPSYSLEEIFDDFVQYLPAQAASVNPYPWIATVVGGGTYDQYPGTAGSAPDAAEQDLRGGYLELKVTANNDAVCLVRGQETFVFDGSEVIFRASVCLPATATNCLFSIGLKGRDSSASHPFDYSGVGFSYDGGVFAGNWAVETGVGGTINSYDSGVALNPGGWHELMLVFNGTDVDCYIDNSIVKTLLGSQVPTSPTTYSDLMGIVVSLVRYFSSGAKTAIVDYVYRSKKVTR